MADHVTSASSHNGPSRTPLVFVTDASVEATRIGDLLRASGYEVADVSRSMLASRVATQPPNVVLIDVDVDGILEDIARVRSLPGSGAIDFVYVGTTAGPIKNADDALAHEASAFFVRPIDVGGLLRRLEALTGGPFRNVSIRPTTPPPSIPASRGVGSIPSPRALVSSPDSLPPSSQARSSAHASERPSPPSLPSPGVRSPGSPVPASPRSFAAPVEPPRGFGNVGVSSELRQLLEEAEQRAEVSQSDLSFLTPEEEIEAVLPPDVLASLDEPLDGDDDGELLDAGRGRHETGAGRERDGLTGRGATTGASLRTESSVSGHEPRTTTAIPRRDTSSIASVREKVSERAEPFSMTPAATLAPREGQGIAEPPARVADRALARRASVSPPVTPGADDVVLADMTGGMVFGAGEARKFFAEAIARRATGALCFEHEGLVRRVVLRDGDLVTAASWGQGESLVSFLGARGELGREDAERLEAKIFPYGRHAGAALIALGWLGQDQLWSVLRAHAEWIASAIVALPAGVGQFEPEVTGRLGSEPQVFGASTGASVFVELVRRAIPADEALECLGGESSRLTDGPHAELLAECNLSAHEADVLARTRGGTVADLLAHVSDPELVAVVHALTLLGVIEVVPQLLPGPSSRAVVDQGDDGALLEQEAIRSRVRARMELVEDGDYFAVLGIGRSATSYEVRRAYVELRRAFEPSRLLSPALRELEPDVRKILVILDEAYEVLRDGPRRERYRRAIDARPA